MEQATWLGSPPTAGFVLTWAGSWAGWVSTPLFQFLLLRWYFRMFLWWLLSGVIAARILYHGASLPDFTQEIGGAAVILLLLVLFPLFFFVSQLNRVRRRGIEEYGALASRYVADFDRKWLRGGGPADEPLVGTADLQSLADLGGSLEFVQTMRPVPFGRQALIPIVTAVGVPLLPLLLTMFQLDELLSKLAGILL